MIQTLVYIWALAIRELVVSERPRNFSKVQGAPDLAHHQCCAVATSLHSRNLALNPQKAPAMAIIG